MVNDKMVNSMMKKKVYIIPQLEVTSLGVLGKWMKDIVNPSDMPAEMAPGQRTDRAF